MKHFLFKRNSLRSLLFICLTGIYISTAHAQASWNFAAPTDGAGSSGAETGRGICTDASGNIYTIGVFTGTSDFDILAGNQFGTSSNNDGYVASYDKNGTFRWKLIIGGAGNDFGQPSGGITTNGTDVWFTGTVNMGGGSATVVNAALSQTVTVTGSASNGNDAIVAKLSCSNGNILWARSYGINGTDGGQGICVDPNGCCYTMGQYTNGFTIGAVTFPTPTGGSLSDIYIAKFSASGTLIHVATGGASAAGDMGFDGGSLCYVPGATPAIVAVGSFGAGTATFGSFTGIASSGLNDAVLLELDTTLGFTNALGMGTAGQDELLGAVYDPFSGGVFVCGAFGANGFTMPGTTALSTAGMADIVVASYNVANNNFNWSRSAGGTNPDQANAIAVDGQGAILVTGFVSSVSANFGSLNMTTNGTADDIFVVRYNPSGTPVWLVPGGGTAGDDGRGIASYIQSTPYVQSVYVTGNFQGTANFGSTSLVGDGGNDFLVARVNDLSVPLSATQSQVNLTCNGVCTGSATVVASGGTAPYTYSWSPSGGSGATASSLCATNYTVTITDATLTSITKTFNITQPPAITITTLSQTNISCFGGSNGAAQVSASGGTGTLNYNWTPGNPSGDGTGSVSSLTAQVYTVTVTDQNSCTATRTFNITQPPVLSTTGSQTNNTCFGGSTGSATVVVSGGTPSYFYSWAPSGGNAATTTGRPAGNYTVTVTDANGCIITPSFVITQPLTAVSGSTVVTNVACFGGSNGAINLTPSGGTGPYTFNWLPSGPTTEDRTGLTAGTYSVQITDANGCTGTVTATVTQPPTPVSGTTVVTNVACFGGSNGAIDLTPNGGTGPYTFNWLPSGPATEDRTGLTAGTYSVQITDVNGCSGTVTATVTQPASPVSGTTVVTNVACFGGSDGAIDLTPTGGTPGYTYDWGSSISTQDRTTLATGSYTVVITDVNGCTGTVTATVTQPSAISISITAQADVSCNGSNDGSVTVAPSGGTGSFTYSWAPSGGNAATAPGLSAGTYSVTVTDAAGCTSTQTVIIAEPTLLMATSSSTPATCGGNNGTATANVSGGTASYSYSWSPFGGTNSTATSLTSGTYTCTVTDANGCTTTTTVNVNTTGGISASITASSNISCNGGSDGSATAAPTGGTSPFTYAWTPTGGNAPTASGLGTGTYTCTITDVNGCEATTTVAVTEPTLITASVSHNNISCNGANNGSATVTATGGTGSFTYAWSPSGGNAATASGLAPGTYTCLIADANGCTQTETVTITEPSILAASISSQNITCNAASNGSATVIVSGGTPSYSFIWTPSGGTNAMANGLAPGTYTCTITDANGCILTQTTTITQPTTIAVAMSKVDATCPNNDGTATAAVSGGTAPYTYSWTPGGQTTSTATGLSAATYSCTITDANGCSVTRTVTVNQGGCGPAHLTSGFCGITVSSLAQYIYCTPVTNAVNYQYQFRQGATIIATYTRGNYLTNCLLTNIPQLQYAQTYTVLVRAMVGSTWGLYGSPCTITTPAFPGGHVTNGSCGTTLSSLTSAIYCNVVPGAANYEWKFMIGATTTATYQRGNNITNCFPSNVSGLQYGQGYDVYVRAYVGGVWGSYGTSCVVTMPAFPITQVSSTWCNGTVSNLSSGITCDAVAGATDYQWRVQSGPFISTMNRGNNQTNWRLSWNTGTTVNTTYNVSVRAFVGGVWGSFGPVCTIAVGPNMLPQYPGDEIRPAEVRIANPEIFEAETMSMDVYPNPFATNITVVTNPSVKAVLIYNSFGEFIRSVDLENGKAEINLGELASGIYLIQATSAFGVITKTVIKQD